MGQALVEECLNLLSTFCGVKDFLYMMIIKDIKYNHCHYRHHSCYTECKTRPQTLVYTVSVFQLLGRVVGCACGWLATITAQCEITTLTYL